MQRRHYDKYLLDKLMAMPEQFMEKFREKDWAGAKYIYDTAIRISTFMEVPEDVKEKLFGNRATAEEGEEQPGLFYESMVQRVYLECAIKRRLDTDSVESRRRMAKAQKELLNQK